MNSSDRILTAISVSYLTGEPALAKVSLTLTREHLLRLDDACREQGCSRADLVMAMIEIDATRRSRGGRKKLRELKCSKGRKLWGAEGG